MFLKKCDDKAGVVLGQIIQNDVDLLFGPALRGRGFGTGAI